MTDDEISLLTIECKYFVQNARDVCGRKISIEEILNERRQNKADKFRKAEEASFKNFQRWQQEQDDIQKAINERRELQMQDLQDELRRIEERKLVKRMEEIQHEKNYLDDVKNIEIAEMETENEATRKRIEIYEKLNKKLDEEVVMKEKLITNLHKKFTENTMEIQLQSNDVESDEKISEMNGNLQQQQQTMSTDEMNNLVQTTTPLSEAQKNKMKVMSHEYNFSSFSSLNDPNGNASMPEAETPTLTEAQRNKLKIMGHEFEMIEIEKAPKITLEKSDVLTDLQKNRLKVLSSEFYLNENHSEHQSNKKISELNLLHVSPRISQNLESPVNSDIMAMSMTSDHFSNESTEMKETSSSSNDDDKHDKHDMNDDDDDLFRAFEEAIEKNSSYFMGVELSQITKSYENVKSTDALEMSKLLQKSIMIPVNAYMEILNNETLKMFVENLNIISHFKSLRNYFLMMNGEFSISVCHQLFTKLENNIKPSELLNYQSLHMILDHALSNSRHDENTEQLSFIVKNIPENFEIYSPAVLNMLTLSYKLQWPLNLILNPETMEQYQAIFNYLLKLKRISWVLDECVQLLKTLHKKHGKNLLHSPQFRNVQQIRHKMTHVVHCLENYVTRNVLQISWIGFMEDLKKAESVHCVYKKHTSFLKRILFLCLLNKKSAEFQRQIEDSFKVILRFHK
jgi:gamma-tubulin complex component 6